MYGTVTVDGRIWMDRNLGATAVATSYDTQAAYGWLYQWGRASDGHQYTAWGGQPSPALSATTTILSTTDSPGHANFITSNSGKYDWRNPQKNTLWATASGSINNPCPTGWHVPSQAEWVSVVTVASITNPTTAASSALHLPAAGYRVNNGTLLNQGSYGYYWSSSPNSTLAYGLYLNSSSVYPASSNYRAYGFSVRCVKN
jgi:uncharacterized protein (TIGR02145 family)